VLARAIQSNEYRNLMISPLFFLPNVLAFFQQQWLAHRIPLHYLASCWIDK